MEKGGGLQRAPERVSLFLSILTIVVSSPRRRGAAHGDTAPWPPMLRFNPSRRPQRMSGRRRRRRCCWFAVERERERSRGNVVVVSAGPRDLARALSRLFLSPSLSLPVSLFPLVHRRCSLDHPRSIEYHIRAGWSSVDDHLTVGATKVRRDGVTPPRRSLLILQQRNRSGVTSLFRLRYGRTGARSTARPRQSVFECRVRKLCASRCSSRPEDK